jgi:excisionase family DNA binding protein
MAAAGNEVLSVHDVAERLGVHYKTALRYIRTGRLKAAKPGNILFIKQEWLEEFLTDQQAASDQRAAS